MSWQTMMTFASEPAAGNALRFATCDEAEAYGRDLFSRWTYPTGHYQVQSGDPVNARWEDGRLVMLQDA